MNEGSLRKKAKRLGLMLVKSRKKINIDNIGGFMITDINKGVIQGSRYELTEDEVKDYLDWYEKNYSHSEG